MLRKELMLCTSTAEAPWSRFRITVGEGHAGGGEGGHYGYYTGPYGAFGSYSHISGEDLRNYKAGSGGIVYFCQNLMFSDRLSFLEVTGWSYDSPYTWKIVNETTGFEDVGTRLVYDGNKYANQPAFFYVDPTDINTIVASYNNALGKTYTISIYQVSWTT